MVEAQNGTDAGHPARGSSRYALSFNPCYGLPGVEVFPSPLIRAESLSWGCPNPKPFFCYATSLCTTQPWMSPPAPAHGEGHPLPLHPNKALLEPSFFWKSSWKAQLMQTFAPSPDSAWRLHPVRPHPRTQGGPQVSQLDGSLTGPWEPFRYSQIKRRFLQDTVCHSSDPLGHPGQGWECATGHQICHQKRRHCPIGLCDLDTGPGEEASAPVSSSTVGGR